MLLEAHGQTAWYCTEQIHPSGEASIPPVRYGDLVYEILMVFPLATGRLSEKVSSLPPAAGGEPDPICMLKADSS